MTTVVMRCAKPFRARVWSIPTCILTCNTTSTMHPTAAPIELASSVGNELANRRSAANRASMTVTLACVAIVTCSNDLYDQAVIDQTPPLLNTNGEFCPV